MSLFSHRQKSGFLMTLLISSVHGDMEQAVRLEFALQLLDRYFPKLILSQTPKLISTIAACKDTYEQPHRKTNNLPRRNCEADQRLCFRYSNRTVALLL